MIATRFMAWARRGLGDGGMARTQGAPNQRKRDKLRIADFVPDCIRLAVLQATKRQTIGNQIDFAMIFARYGRGAVRLEKRFVLRPDQKLTALLALEAGS